MTPIGLFFLLVGPWYYPVCTSATRYRSWLSPLTLFSKSGVFFRSEKSVPLDRITDIVIKQGPVLRHSGLHALYIQTAGMGDQMPEICLYGIRNPTEIRNRILEARDRFLKSKTPIGA